MSETTQIILAVVPALISAFVAWVEYRNKQDFERSLAEANRRIAVLEQILIDHGIPLPGK